MSVGLRTVFKFSQQFDPSLAEVVKKTVAWQDGRRRSKSSPRDCAVVN
jgi:hypothetical protein